MNWFLSVAEDIYLSPVETHCMNIDYFIPDEENQTREFSDDAMARLRKNLFKNTLYTFIFILTLLQIYHRILKEANVVICAL